jgi:oligoendopeptidase F
MSDHSESPQDFAALPAYRPRTFVPAEVELTRADTVIGLYQRLLDRPAATPETLEQWLLDRSELDAAVNQAYTILYIRMTCQTDDPARAEAHKKYIETVEPAVAAISDKLDRKYLESRQQAALDERRYAVYERRVRADVDLFRQENIPLKTEESLLAQEYQAVSGAMTVEFQGAERTMPEMGKFLLEPDRDLREAAWRAAARRRMADRDRLDGLFEKMLAVRARLAANAGCRDFAEYQFRAFHRFDYTPADCRAYHEAVARTAVPLLHSILDDRRRRMRLDRLRPWDTAVDPEGLPPLKPFAQPDELTAKAGEVFRRTDPALGDQFATLDRLGLLDLTSRKGKAPGGYQAALNEARRPFIFMNAVGTDGDVRTLLHEGGHAFHSLAAAREPLVAYRHAPLEFCEVASMGMELLADGHLDVFYGPEDLKRSRRRHLEGIVSTLPWVATIDAFQQWIYSHPGHGREDRRAAWLETFDRFGGGVVDWTGLDEEKACWWHRQLHIFEYPFYYIEYGIAQLGALGLWAHARRDAPDALGAYRRALALGGSRPLPELFAAAGIRFDFSEATIAPLMRDVAEQLARL